MQSIGDTRLDDMPGIPTNRRYKALDPKTGEVLSVYAGSDYLSKQPQQCRSGRIRTV